MASNDIVEVSVLVTTKAAQQTSFGIPAVLSDFPVQLSQTKTFPERTRVYTAVSDMITDGFTATHPAVLAVGQILSQELSPSEVVVGRCKNGSPMVIKVTPNTSDIRADYDYLVTLNGEEVTLTSLDNAAAKVTDSTTYPVSDQTGLTEKITVDGGTEQTVTFSTCTSAAHVITRINDQTTGLVASDVGGHVVLTSDTTGPLSTIAIGTGTCALSWGTPSNGAAQIGANICDQLKTEIDLLGYDITVADGTTYVTITADAVDDAFSFYANEPRLLLVEDNTPNVSPGIVEDIVAIQAENDTWYGLTTTNQGAAVAAAAAVYLETLGKVFIASSPDYDLTTTASNDIGTLLNTASYNRTAVFYHPKANVQFPGAALFGRCLPETIGSITWDLKSLVGVDSIYLTPTEITNLMGKKVNFYTTQHGIAMVQNGVFSSGRQIDITNAIDFIVARMQERIVTLLASVGKVPYTDPGIALVENEVKAVLSMCVGQGILAADPEPVVTVPAVSSVSSSDKSTRVLNSVEFQATLAGAIEKVVISGRVVL